VAAAAAGTAATLQQRLLHKARMSGKVTASRYMSVQNSMMEWDLSHSDCVGVIRSVTFLRRNDKVKRRQGIEGGIRTNQNRRKDHIECNGLR